MQICSLHFSEDPFLSLHCSCQSCDRQASWLSAVPGDKICLAHLLLRDQPSEEPGFARSASFNFSPPVSTSISTQRPKPRPWVAVAGSDYLSAPRCIPPQAAMGSNQVMMTLIFPPLFWPLEIPLSSLLNQPCTHNLFMWFYFIMYCYIFKGRVLSLYPTQNFARTESP